MGATAWSEGKMAPAGSKMARMQGGANKTAHVRGVVLGKAALVRGAV